MESVGEYIGVSEVGVFGMVEGKGLEVREVGIRGATRPRANGGCQRVGGWWARSGTAQRFPKEGKVIEGKL